MTTSPYIVELKTAGGINIKNTISSISGILKEANLIFDKNGLKIKAMDPTTICFVHVSINSDKLDKYVYNNTNDEFRAGVNTLSLAKYLSAVKRHDILTFRIKKDNPGVLCIKVENKIKNQTWYYELFLMHIEHEEEIEIGDHTYNCEITMIGTDFQDTCKHLAIISDKLILQSRDDKIIFSVDGGASGSGKGKLVKYSDYDDEDEDEEPNKKNKMKLKMNKEGRDIIKASFSMAFLLLFAKSATLDQNVYIYFDNDKALILKYPIAEIGFIRYALAPLIDED